MSQVIADMTVLSAGGGSVLADLENVKVNIAAELKECQTAPMDGIRRTETKLRGTVDATLKNVKSGGDCVSHLEATRIVFAGEDIKAVIESLDFSGSFTSVKIPSIGALWEVQQVTGRDYSGGATIVAPDANAATFLLRMTDADPAQRAGVLGITLNGTLIDLPMRLSEGGFEAATMDVQKFPIQLVGNAPRSGAYPTNPTGTTSLLAKAMNDFRTKLAFTMTTHATEGATVTGYLTWRSLAFQIRDEEIVTTNYGWNFSGTVAGVAT